VLGNAEIKAEGVDGTLTLALEAVPNEETKGELTRMDLLLSPEKEEEEEEGTFAPFTLKSKADDACPAALENGKVKNSILCFWSEPIKKMKYPIYLNAPNRDPNQAN
jgi:hypothetical protein